MSKEKLSDKIKERINWLKTDRFYELCKSTGCSDIIRTLIYNELIILKPEIEALEYWKDNYNFAADELHQLNQKLKAEKDALLNALVDSCYITCQLCVRLNPQHKHCTSCDGEDYKHDLIEQLGGKSWDQTIKEN